MSSAKEVYERITGKEWEYVQDWQKKVWVYWYSLGVLESKLAHSEAYIQKRKEIAQKYGISITAAQELMGKAEETAGVTRPEEINYDIYDKNLIELLPPGSEIREGDIVKKKVTEDIKAAVSGTVILVGVFILIIWYLLLGGKK